MVSSHLAHITDMGFGKDENMEVHVSAVPPYFLRRLSIAVASTRSFPSAPGKRQAYHTLLRPAAREGFSPETARCLSPIRILRKDILSQTARPDYSSPSLPLE